MSHRAQSLALISLVSVVGCMEGVPVAREGEAGAGQPRIKAEFNSHRTELLESRWLLLPVTMVSDQQALIGSMFISGSSWSGLCSGSWSSPTINLEVVDLAKSTHQRVFDRPVALAWFDWRIEQEPSQQAQPRFPGLLVIHARTEDIDGDRQIDDDDAVGVYAYDLEAGKLTRLSPEGWHVADARPNQQSVVMILESQKDPKRAAVYVCDPRSAKGSFAARDLQP